MKKRIISLLLAVCMCAQMLPVAFAEDIAVSDSNNSVQEEQSETETPDNQTAPAGGDPAQMAEPQEQAESEEKSQSIEQMESTTAPTPEATSTPEAEVEGVLPVATATPTVAPAAPQAATLAEGPTEGATVVGSGECGENLIWTEYSDGRLVISGTGEMYDYEINTSNTAPWSKNVISVVIEDGVTSIGNGAFYEREQLCDVEIPNSVSIIGKSVFYRCHALADIDIPKSITSIGTLAFADCDSLSDIIIPDLIKSIEDSTFLNCKGIKSVAIPENVTKIGEDAFSGCTELTEVVIKGSVTTIGDGAFQDCTSLYSINLPNELTDIGTYAFKNCSSLISVEIPASVATVGYHAFEGCSSLGKLVVRGDQTKVDVGGAFNGCTSLKSAGPIGSGSDYEFPWVTAIPAYAFEGCDGLETIIFPDGITSIGSQAFSNCGMKEVVIPDSVTSMGTGVFGYCSNLTNIVIPDSITEIPDSTFQYCSSLNQIELPENLTRIGKWAFQYCSSLKSVELPDSLTKLDMYAFYECRNLESIYIPIGVDFIDIYTFKNCNSLTDIYYAGSEDEWNNIYKSTSGNDALFDATVHYNFSQTDPKGFWPQRDGWCINNTFAPLGLDEEYSSEWLQYYDIVCSIHPLKWFEKAFGQFQGYCFGYSLLAAAQYENKIDLQEYFPNNGGDTLNTFGWQTIESLEDGTQYYSLVGNAKAIDVIERAHYMQVASGISRGEIGKGDTDYSDVLAYLQKENSLPLLVCVNDRKNNFSHAMLTDTTVKPVEAYPGWYVIYCYDPNAPQYTNELENSAYSLPESYIWICPGTGEWQYFCNDTCTAEDEYYSTADIFALTTPTIRFYDISDFTKSYFTDKLALQDDNPKSIYVGGVSIYDHAKNLIFSVLDGMQDARGDWRPFCEDEETSSNVSKGTVLYPENAKIIESTGDAGVLNVWNDALIAYTADGDVSVEINEENTTATITNTGSKTVTFSLALGNQTEAASTSAAGTLEAGKKLTMTLIGEEVTAVTDSDETKITTELYLDGDDTVDESQFHISAHTITVSAGENGTITPSDSVLVVNGDSQTFNIIPNNGYVVADVQVDGVSVGAVSQYTFNDVKVDHTIYASFEPKQEQSEPEIESFTVTGTPTKTTYNLGEAFDATGLTLTVTYDDGTIGTITSGYDVTPAVMEADTTQVVLSYGGVEAKPITGLTVRENLVSIQAPQAITGLPNGTEKTAKALGLPGTVKITTSRTQQPTTEATVTWDVENCTYDPNSKSAQTFTVQGTVVLPDGMTNLQNVPLTIGVSVKVKANDDTPENPDYPSDSENPTTSGNTESNGVSSLSTVTSEAQSASDDAGQTNDAQITIVPQTSDTLPVTGLIVLMAVSFVAVLALMVKRKKKQ